MSKTVETTIEKLSTDDSIPVMSFSFYPLTLTTRNIGGIEYNFSRFGEIKHILYLHLNDIIESHRSFAEYPYFYIMDERVVDRHGLQEVYAKTLNKEKIDKVLECNSKEVIDLYKSTSDNQKKIINRIVLEKLIKGEDVDLNIVNAFSKESNYDIMEEYKKAKIFAEEIVEE